MQYSDIIEAGRRLYNRQYVSGRDGNISVRLPNEHILATCSGVSKGFITENDIVELSIEGDILKGSNPSSEIKMHLAIYKENPSIGAVVHAHPLYATICACSGIELEKKFLAEAAADLGTVKIAPFAYPGTIEVGESVAPFVRGNSALLLESHGAVTWAKDLEHAMFLMESLENYAHMYLLMQSLGIGKELSDEQVKRLRNE